MKRLIPILFGGLLHSQPAKKTLTWISWTIIIWFIPTMTRRRISKTLETYYLPDSILVIGDKENAEYWKDENAQEILSAYVANMNSRGTSVWMTGKKPTLACR